MLEELNVGTFSTGQLNKLALKQKFYRVLTMNTNDVIIAINHYVKHKIADI